MRGKNKVILIGNVGQDPELKNINDDLKVAKFTLATNESYKGEDRVEWHNVSCFNKLAEIVAQYVYKGTPLYIEGGIRTNKYETKTGETRYFTEIIAKEIIMLGKGEDRSNESTAPKEEAAEEDDGLPF